MSNKVVCNNANKCDKSCDTMEPIHKLPHEKHYLCRDSVCLQTGKIVKCVEVNNEK